MPKPRTAVSRSHPTGISPSFRCESNAYPPTKALHREAHRAWTGSNATVWATVLNKCHHLAQSTAFPIIRLSDPTASTGPGMCWPPCIAHADTETWQHAPRPR